MKHYQSRLLEQLAASGWKRLQKVSDGLPWWLSEYWQVVSQREPENLRIVISFLVEPLYDGENKSSTIYEIAAQTQIPDDRLDESNRIATLSMRRGNYDEKLSALLSELERFRRNIN